MSSMERQPHIPQDEPEEKPLKDSASLEAKIPDVENKGIDPEVRQFSRFTDAEARQQLAQEISERRTLRQRLAAVDTDAAQKAIDIENLSKSAERLRQQADDMSSSLWGRMTSWNARPRLEKLIVRKMTLKEIHERELAELQQVKADTELVLAGRHDAADDRALVASYYEGKKEQVEEFKKNTQVDYIMREQNALFIHGMGEYVPEYNSVLMADGRINLETKLRILLGLQPTVSTSTIKEGEGGERMMHQVGVILNGGTVETAHGFDSGTVPTSVKGRSRRSELLSEQQAFLRDPKSHINEAINNKSGPWNELVVSGPEAAALYFAYEFYEEKGSAKKILGLQDLAQKYDFPLYCLKNGKPYEFTLELREERDQYGYPYKGYVLDTIREVSIVEIGETKRKVEENERKNLLNEVLGELPFDPEKIGITEATHIKNSELGREMACVLNALKHPESGVPTQYELWENQHDSVVPPTSPIHMVEDFHALAGRNQYFFHEGKLYERYSPSIWDHRPQEPNIYTRTIDYAVFFYQQIHSPEELFTAIQKRFQDIQQREMEYKAKSEDDLVEEGRIMALKEEISLMLYGFAEESVSNGEQELATRAEAMAGEIGVFSVEQYKDLRARRIKDGTFVLYPEDLGMGKK